MAKDKLPKTGEEIEQLRIALALVGIAVNSELTCLILEVFKEVQKLGGQFSIRDAVRIQYDVQKRYNRVEITAVPNNEQNDKTSVATED